MLEMYFPQYDSRVEKMAAGNAPAWMWAGFSFYSWWMNRFRDNGLFF